MKTFEEKFTAWIDGELKGEELVSFEAELARTEDAKLEKAAALQLGDLLREHGQAPELRNTDFFNTRIMQEIQAGMPKPRPARERPAFAWSLLRIGLAGAFSLLVGVGVFQYFLPKPVNNPGGLTEIIKAQSNDPDVKATAFYSQKNDATVIWLEYKSDKKNNGKASK